MISVGGWTGSRHFSKVRASKDYRATFADTFVNLCNTYDLDDLDLDRVRDPSIDLIIPNILSSTSWEYPGSQSGGFNPVLPRIPQTFFPSSNSCVLLTGAASPSPGWGSTTSRGNFSFPQLHGYHELRSLPTGSSWSP